MSVAHVWSWSRKAVSCLSDRFLLDVSWWLEDSRQWILWVQPLQRKPWYSKPEPTGSGQRGPQEISLLLWEGEDFSLIISAFLLTYCRNEYVLEKSLLCSLLSLLWFHFLGWKNCFSQSCEKWKVMTAYLYSLSQANTKYKLIKFVFSFSGRITTSLCSWRLRHTRESRRRSRRELWTTWEPGSTGSTCIMLQSYWLR